MLCLSESIRHDDPRLQQGLQTAYHAANLTELILAAWALSRLIAVQVVESVLQEWANSPTQWPSCPECGKRLHSKGLVKREVTSILGTSDLKKQIALRQAEAAPNTALLGFVEIPPAPASPHSPERLELDLQRTDGAHLRLHAPANASLPWAAIVQSFLEVK